MNANQLLTIEDEYDGVSIYIVHVCPYLWKSECTVRKSAQFGRFLHVHFFRHRLCSLLACTHIHSTKRIHTASVCVYVPASVLMSDCRLILSSVAA